MGKSVELQHEFAYTTKKKPLKHLKLKNTVIILKHLSNVKGKKEGAVLSQWKRKQLHSSVEIN